MSLTAIDPAVLRRMEAERDTERALRCSRGKHHVEWTRDAYGTVYLLHEDVQLVYDAIDLRNDPSPLRMAERDTRDVCRALAYPEPSDILTLFDTEGDYS